MEPCYDNLRSKGFLKAFRSKSYGRVTTVMCLELPLRK